MGLLVLVLAAAAEQGAAALDAQDQAQFAGGQGGVG
jgi:hypothetical protein